MVDENLKILIQVYMDSGNTEMLLGLQSWEGNKWEMIRIVIVNSCPYVSTNIQNISQLLSDIVILSTPDIIQQ